MSTENRNDKIHLVCNMCGDITAEGCEYFDQIPAFRRSEGWKASKESGEWMDLCQDCQ